jgi:multidrug resistance efflux pump
VSRRTALLSLAAVAAGSALGLAAASGRSARTDATVSLTATGTIQAPQQLQLAFAQPGRLVAVDVHAGEAVSAGTVLARLDPGPALAGVETAAANLAAARAQLLQLRQGLAPAERTQVRVGLRQSLQALDAARRSLLDVEASAAQGATGQQTALEQAQAQLSADQGALSRDQDTLAADRSAADIATGQVTSDRSQLATDQAALLKAQKQQADDEGASALATTLAADAKAILSDQAAADADQARLSDDANAVGDAHSTVASDQAQVGADQNAIAADQNAVANATNAAAARSVAERQSVDTARAAVDSTKLGVSATRADNAVRSEPPRVGTLAAARAAIRVAEAALATAEQSLAQTRLVAPFAGTVASVDAVGGQLVPDSGGTALLTLVNLGQLTVTASFDGAEAALLAPGQPAAVTVPDLAGRELAGRIVAVDPLPDPPTGPGNSSSGGASGTADGQPASGTTPSTYTATIALTDPPARLWPGMQADVSVAATTAVRGG